MRRPPDDEWWRGMVVYQIYLRSFQDTNGDGVGDLPGVLERLDYITSLGVDAVWLSPFYASPQEDFGYDVSDFRTVQPEMGTIEDFERLRDALHERGMKLFIDFIPDHTSDQHAWFRESRGNRENPKADWYVWADAAPDGTAPNNWISSFGGPAWTWDPRRAQFYFHPFLTCQPALNLQKPEVLEAMLEELDFWLRQGVDGVRLDAVQCITCDMDLRPNPRVSHKGSPILLGGGPDNPFARQLHLFDRDVPEALDIFKAMAELAGRYDPPKMLLGELSDVDSPVVCEKYTGRPDGLDATYDYDFVNTTPRVENWRSLLVRQRDVMPHGWNFNVFNNQDATRVLSNFGEWAVELGHQDAMAKLLNVLQMTLRGGVVIYQGQELALTQAEIPKEQIVDPWGLQLWPDFKGRDGCRTPMPWEHNAPHCGFTDTKPWLPVAEDHKERAADRQDADEASPLNFTRRFVAWRRTQPALQLGDVRFLDIPAPLLAFERFDDRTCLLVVLNFSAEPRRFGAGMALRALEAPGLAGALSGDGIDLPPLQAFIGQRLDARPPADD
ncbi:alpha-amylase family glycosyl hydrolase [Ancylobacter sp. MQZ15Z-1]|uniref:Alpha-amylase family glycosyl hydrolase n=1 Tax=Ancylobacter mangrovi TaxID=2972472 RepID=A0A9X2T8C5_9HYPH|nr:alpha-amylase family glycosyl hydrolase [Ancylobacter mangrovi]MCS0497048.1 alpha-amylase family glycosyl hydrolase [Ancylobacter mangrovi]